MAPEKHKAFECYCRAANPSSQVAAVKIPSVASVASIVFPKACTKTVSAGRWENGPSESTLPENGAGRGPEEADTEENVVSADQQHTASLDWFPADRFQVVHREYFIRSFGMRSYPWLGNPNQRIQRQAEGNQFSHDRSFDWILFWERTKRVQTPTSAVSNDLPHNDS